MNKDNLCLIAGSASRDFAHQLASQLNTSIANTETIVFSDGNIFVKINEDIHKKDVMIVQSLYGHDSNNHFLELLFLIDACKRYNVTSITAVIPFFSYAKSDKQDGDGTSIRARVCADCLQVAGATRVMLMDLHSPSISGFFSIPVEHVSAMSTLCDHIKNYHLQNLTIVAPDAGFAKQARLYASYLGVPCVICDKNRPDHSESPNVMEIIGNVAGKDCVIVDDFATSGGTLIEATNALLNNHANSVYVAVSHAPLTSTAIEKIISSPIKKVFTTNSADASGTENNDRFDILDVSGLFAQKH
ncbi:MAG: ribose-phosphate diphosphokinase [Pseudomonadales bacterium]|nr:ribose-phosphate diphosphokinase [Pseudomonadales bacterium]